MADNYDKLAVQHSLNQVAVNRARELIGNTGRALPCRVTAVSGSIVTVAFEVNAGNQTMPSITIPKNESQWIRYPIQVGDFGVTEPADAYLGGISGLGGGVAKLSQPRGNLTALMFTPCGATSFPAVNVNAAYIAGPEGAVIQTSDGASVVTVSESGVTITAGGKTWSFTAAGFTMSTGIVSETHQHTYIPGTEPPAPTSEPIA
jgi:hypothetical protein